MGNLSGVCFHASLYSLACSWHLPVGNTPPSLSQSLCIWMVPSCRRNRETTHHSLFSPLLLPFPLLQVIWLPGIHETYGIEICLTKIKYWLYLCQEELYSCRGSENSQFLYTVDSTRAIRDSLFWILGTFLLTSRVSLNFRSYKNLVFGMCVSPSEDSKEPCWNWFLFEMNKNEKCDCLSFIKSFYPKKHRIPTDTWICTSHNSLFDVGRITLITTNFITMIK